MNETYLSRFHDMVDGLFSTPGVDVTELQLNDAATDSDLSALGFKLPTDLELLYRGTNGFRLEWTSVNGTEPGPVRGAIDIPTTAELAGLIDAGLPLSVDARGLDWVMLPVDFFVEEAATAMKLSHRSEIHAHLFYCKAAERPVDTGLDFDEYLDRLIASRGFWYWIEAVCRETRDGPQAKNFLQHAPKLFPSLNVDLFVPKT